MCHADATIAVTPPTSNFQSSLPSYGLSAITKLIIATVPVHSDDFFHLSKLHYSTKTYNAAAAALTTDAPLAMLPATNKESNLQTLLHATTVSLLVQLHQRNGTTEDGGVGWPTKSIST